MSESELKAINEKIASPLGRLYWKENTVYSSPLLDKLIRHGFYMDRPSRESPVRHLHNPAHKRILSGQTRIDLLVKLSSADIDTLIKSGKSKQHN